MRRVELDRHARLAVVVDRERRDGSDAAIGQARVLLGLRPAVAGELYPVAGRELRRAVLRRQAVILRQVAALPVQGAGVLVQARNVLVGVGEHEAAFVRRRRNVGGVPRRHVLKRVALPVRPINPALLGRRS